MIRLNNYIHSFILFYSINWNKPLLYDNLKKIKRNMKWTKMDIMPAFKGYMLEGDRDFKWPTDI